MRIDYSTYFERHNCSSESVEFNASRIIEKYQDLTQQMRLRRFNALVDRPPSSNPSLARINICALTTRHTLRDIIVALNQSNSMLQE
jgi:hypothetical protein